MGSEIPAINTCRICGNDQGNQQFSVREMMFGLREEFDYFECSACGCLQIAAVPDDLARHYSGGYYSMQATTPGWMQRFLKRQRARYAVGKGNFLGQLLTRRYGEPIYAEWIRRANIAADDAILDVGCGSGQLLLDMHEAGFANLTGIDPYIEQDIRYPNGVTVHRRSLEEIDTHYDFVMLHHVFEHVTDPRETLRDVHRVLRPGRMAVVRIPVADSFAWRHYKTDWVQLDAPRHLYIHTVKSMRILAAESCLEIVDIVRDSDAYQLWGSELVKRDIAISDPRAGAGGTKIFTPEQMQSYRTRATELNSRGEGDSAVFYLKRL